MFEQAARLKLRFPTSKGELAVEDLWDLPLTSQAGKANLDELARELYQRVEQAPTISFVNSTKNPGDVVAKLKFDIELHVINTRLAENEAANKAKDIRERKQKIMALIEQKQNEQLAGSSIDDLRAMLDAL